MSGEVSNGDRSAIMVLGMHRSGTSAVARILNLFGAALPERLMPAASSNSEGHFEPAEIVAVHDALLASVGSAWSDWAAFPQAWYATPACEAYVGRLREEIRTDYPGTGPIIVKDPRILRFIPLWLRVLEGTGLTPFAVLPFRDPYEVAASLAARNGLPMEHGYLLWLRHVLDAEFHTRGIGRTFVSYEELLTNATVGVRGLLDGLPIERPDEADRIVEDAARTLDAKLRHNTVGEAGFAAGAGMPEQVRLAHALYERLRRDPHDARATASLDVVRADLDRYAGMARAVFRSLDVPPDPSAQDRLNESTAHALSELGGQVAGLGGQVAGLGGQVARLSESTAHTLSGLGGQVAGQAGGLAEQGARLAQVGEIVSANQGLTHGIVERLSHLRIQVAQLKTQDEAARSGLASIGRDLEALGQAFEARAEADRRRIDGELQALGAALAAQEAALAAQEAAQEAAQVAAERRLDRRLDRQQELIESLLGALTDVRGRVQQREHAGPSRGWPFRLGRPGNPQEAGVAALVLRSGLFDPDWYRRRYLAQNPADTDPLGHFLETGLGARLSPGPLFDVDAYAAADPAAAQSPDGPFLHYLRHRSPDDRPFLADGPLSDG